MSETTPISHCFKADGTVDYNKLYCCSTSETNNKILSKNPPKKATTTLKQEAYIKYHNNLIKSKTDKGNESIVPTLKKKQLVKKEKKEKVENEDIIEGTPLSNVEFEMIQIPELKHLLINSEDKRYSQYNEAQKLNISKTTSRYGKEETLVTSNTWLGHSISKLKPRNFGSIGDFDVDSIPLSYGRLKGTEVTFISYETKQIRNSQIISRRFASKVLSTWCYIVGIRYKPKEESSEINGIELWGKYMEHYKQPVISGQDIILMLKDIMFLTRNKSVSKLKEYIENQKVSPQLYMVISTKRYQTKDKYRVIINEMKNRLYYEYQVPLTDIVWDYPKYSMEYLMGVVNELQSGKYLTDLIIPLIKDLWKYPIKCTDTKVKPLSYEEHETNKDDYDLNKYVFERD